jgi:hypothetical protein
MIWRPSRFIVIVGVCLGAGPSGLRAQGGRTGLGFEVGYSRASFAPSSLTEAREGSLIGGFISQRVSGPLSGQIELLFATKGGALTAATPDGPVRAAVQLVYIEVPLLARATVPLGRRLKPILLGGGSYALSVGCEFQVEVPGAFGQVPCDQSGTGLQLVKSDMSAIVGGGLEYAWGSSAVRLELRRFIGLRTVVEGSEGKNRAWVALFGVTF